MESKTTHNLAPFENPLESLETIAHFPLELHLRDFLKRNLHRIEPGLRLYTRAGRDGVEFPVAGGRIDLLAIDQNNKLVVIELKLSRGRTKTLGQLLYYMGWIDKNLGNPPCRGAIIADKISNDLRIAASPIPRIFLAEYKLAFSIDAVPPPLEPPLLPDVPIPIR